MLIFTDKLFPGNREKEHFRAPKIKNSAGIATPLNHTSRKNARHDPDKDIRWQELLCVDNTVCGHKPG